MGTIIVPNKPKLISCFAATIVVVVYVVFVLMTSLKKTTSTSSIISEHHHFNKRRSDDGVIYIEETASSSLKHGHDGDDNDFLEGVSYSQLRKAVIRKYHASDPETIDIDEEWDEALTAMKKIEYDGEPIPINGIDGLYVGSLGAAYNLNGLISTGITHIVSLENAAPCKYPDKFSCLHIQNLWDDSTEENRITPTFSRTLPFIDNALRVEDNGRVLVHCWSGKSRSVATIIGYMINSYDMSPDDALAIIRETRPQASPNHGYKQELDDFYNDYHHDQN